MTEYIDMPRSEVVVGRHKLGAGWAQVYHRRTGTLLGEVVLWEEDGVWISYVPYSDERAGDDHRTREEAVCELLEATIHMPPKYGKDYDHPEEFPCTERELREAFPKEWAHWDMVRALFVPRECAP